MPPHSNGEPHSGQGPTIWHRRDGSRTGSFVVDDVTYLFRLRDPATPETLRQQTLAELEATLQNLTEAGALVGAGADRAECVVRLDASINAIIDLIEVVT